MRTELRRPCYFVALAILIFIVAGCVQTDKNNTGVYVMFDGRPNVHYPEVYFNGRTVGEITTTNHKGATITRLTIAVAPEYKNRINGNWAFYADAGRLLAVRLQGGGSPLQDGDKLCGFRSKAAFNWFKFRTLLSDRTYKASKLADNLSKRFGHL